MQGSLGYQRTADQWKVPTTFPVACGNSERLAKEITVPFFSNQLQVFIIAAFWTGVMIQAFSMATA